MKNISHLCMISNNFSPKYLFRGLFLNLSLIVTFQFGSFSITRFFFSNCNIIGPIGAPISLWNKRELWFCDHIKCNTLIFTIDNDFAYNRKTALRLVSLNLLLQVNLMPLSIHYPGQKSYSHALVQFILKHFSLL